MQTVNYEPLSPLLFLERAHIAYANKTAVVHGDVRKTYLEMYEDCTNVANSFRELGVKRGDRIAYLTKNSYHFLQAHFAVPMLGAILVPINTRFSQYEVIEILKKSGATILVLEDSLYHESYLDIVKQLIIIGGVKAINQSICDYDSFTSLGKKQSPTITKAISDETSTIAINYTSGTSGTAKGAMYSHRSVYLNALGECIEAELSNKSNYLWVLPMFHCNGWCYPWAVTAAGATHVFIDTLQPEVIVDNIVKNNITHFCAAPTVLINLLEAKNISLLDEGTHELKIITAGSTPPSSVIQKYEAMGVTILQVYGLTETLGPHTVCIEQSQWKDCSPDELAQLKASQGVPAIHSVFVKVVDKNMKEVAHDGISMGEIVMRGNNVMQGYYNDEKGTKAAFQGGWFHSGDIAVVQPSGYIQVKDRIKDIIISGGEKISSIEVENVIYQLSSVATVAIIPMYDKKWGERPHAVIELKKDSTLTPQEVIKHCKDNLARFKCPSKITFKSLPKTSTGKIQKHLLKKEFYTTV